MTPDRAFTVYWPPKPGDRRLRLAVKDLIDMKGVVTTAGSEFLLKHSRPAMRDAKCLATARRQNVVIVGKTNLSEFAVRVTGMNTYFGTPVNSLGREHPLIPGGSSSGSAVAVADDLADVAIGTDTAGSIRFPAACCGITGLKTTYGLIPLDGVFPIAPLTLDTIGPMARDVEMTARGMDLLSAGFMPKYRAAMAAKPVGSRIRVARLYLPGTDPRIESALDGALQRAGFQVVRLDAAFQARWEQGTSDGTTVAATGAWLYDQRFGSEKEVSTTTKAVFTVGHVSYVTGFRAALRRQGEWKAALQRVLRSVDFVVLPTMKKLSPRMPLFGGSPALEARLLGVQNTTAVNFAGHPALALPVPVRDKEVPVTSLQLIGPPGGEAQLLNAGRIIEATAR